MKKTVLAAAIALLPVATLADSGLYAGFSIGRSTIEDAGSAGPGESIEKNSTAYKLQLGYRINPNFAIEGGYLNLGKFAYAYRNGANTEDGDDSLGIGASLRLAKHPLLQRGRKTVHLTVAETLE